MVKSIININDNQFLVDVAVKPIEYLQGLLGKEELDSENGMLFVFKEPRIVSMSTRGMKFPIDILFIRENGTTFHVEHNVYPGIKTTSQGKAKYVIELKGETCKSNHINVGDCVEL